MTNEQSVTEAYDAYVEHGRKIREEIRARIEKEVAEAREVHLKIVSRAMHDAFANGVNKTALRRATRQGSNAPGFNKLWDAAQDEYEGEAKPKVGRPRKNPETGETTKPAADKLVLDKEAKTLTLGELKWDLTFTGDDYGRLAPGWRPYRIWDSPEDRHLRSVGVEKFNEMVVDMTADWERE